MKKTLLALMLGLLIPFNSILADSENYKEWEHEEVTGVYVEISAYEAKSNGYDFSFEDGDETRYFEKVKVNEGLYEVEVYEKVDSKFWGLHYSKLFLKFRYNPYLYRFDEGILDWDGYDGIFYKKP